MSRAQRYGQWARRRIAGVAAIFRRMLPHRRDTPDDVPQLLAQLQAQRTRTLDALRSVDGKR